MITRIQISRLPLRKTLAVIALLAFAFAAGWHLSPGETTTGYGLGNEDGYSAGYNDGRNGATPDWHRFMLPEDYELRSQLGGREPAESPAPERRNPLRKATAYLCWRVDHTGAG